MKAKLTFHGGAGTVTGSNFLLEFPSSAKLGTNGVKILIDCGLFQGPNVCEAKNLAPFPYDPASIDFVFVTHAHLDHTGRIPKLVKDGFRGTIISTPPTRDIAELMFFDSLEILRREAGRRGHELIYGEKEIKEALSRWKTVPYRESVLVGESAHVRLKNSGHILGSAMVELSADPPDGGWSGQRSVIFTGDLGNSPSPLLPDAETLAGTAYLVTESVYGDRNHETREERRGKLEDVIEETARRGGVLMVPAFSIERTQEIIFEIERLMDERRIPEMPVFLDSPLAIRVTDVYRKYKDYFNESVKRDIEENGGVFTHPRLEFTFTNDESRLIERAPNPKVIIAGSGMSNGGRIVGHEKRYLPEGENTLLIVGYQAPGSPGRKLEDGAKEIVIDDERVPVRARVESIRGYSAHKDMDALLQFVVHTADTLEEAFVVMGEPKASAFLAQRLRDYVGVNARVPAEGETAELEL